MAILVIALAVLFIGLIGVAANSVGVDTRFQDEPTGIA
jgi:hypothetical protein